MHLIHSALRDQTDHPHQSEISLRYRAYLDACKKHQDLIAEIRKYFPNWMPSPPAP